MSEVRLTASTLLALEMVRRCLPHLENSGLGGNPRWEYANINKCSDHRVKMTIRVRGFVPRIFAECFLAKVDGTWVGGHCSIHLDGTSGRKQHFRCRYNGDGGIITPMTLAVPLDPEES